MISTKKTLMATSLVLLVVIFTCISYKFSESTNQFKIWHASATSSDSTAKILVDINAKRLYIVQNDKIIKQYPIATGKPDTPSPVGDFTIIQKERWGEGFGAAWLGLDVPWGKYGIHGTTRPESIGRAASHGCIRMRNKDINDLYKIAKIGMPVKIIGGPYGLLGNGYRVLVPGDRGADVYLVQTKLKFLGFYKGTVDGIYGTAMERALNNFQKSNNLPITNKIDSNTYKKLGIILME